MKRFIKQAAIASAYAALLVGFVWVVFNALYTPTCTDNIRNQGETRTDCGGPCPSCDLKKLAAPVVVRTAHFLDTQGNTIDLGFQVRNPNGEWGVNRLAYQVDFVDQSGAVIPGSLYGSTFVLPGETKWIMEIAKFVPAQMADVRVRISTSSAVWNKLRPYVSETNFITKDVLFKRLVPPQVGYGELIGTLTNKSGFQVDSVELQGIAYDARGAIIGFSKTTAFGLRIGEVREFRLFWPRPFSKDMKDFQVLVNVNLLDNDTFLQQYGE